MNLENKQRIIDNLFENKFNLDNFKEFVTNILNVKINNRAESNRIYTAFLSYINTYQIISEYNDTDKNKIYVMVIKIKEDKDPVRARIKQREFIAKLLRDWHKDGALVVFYNEESKHWRMSFIRLNYEFTLKGVEEKITPAKRLSYVVGEGEACKTVKDQFYTLANIDESISLDRLEEVFALEKVTNEFFKEYRDKYLDLKDTLIKDENFMNEARKHDTEKPESFAEGFAKKLMGQISFVYFLQKKGWLGLKMTEDKLSYDEYNKLYERALDKERTVLEKVYERVDKDTFVLNKEFLLNLDNKTESELLARAFNLPKYFKEWGSGDKKFLRTLFDKHLEKDKNNGKTFFEDYLEVLFYNNFSEDRGELQYSSEFDSRIPFLNGGLFDPYGDYKWRETNFNIKDELFSNKENTGILDIFDMYNFTVNENDSYETEVAVDPEMLGKVFENLLEVSDRKSKGAFYTPREIVRYMTNESIMNYLLTNLEGKDITKDELEYLFSLGEFTKEYDQQIFEKDYIADKKQLEKNIFGMPRNIITNSKLIDELLIKVKIADPACGSGAFPLGILNEIVRARNILTFYINMIEVLKDKDEKNYWRRIDKKQKERKLYKLKLETIQNCLYGVDIEPSAIDITKLRLWLSIIVDSDNNNVRPLPNLDFNFMIGNSLVDEFEGMKLFDESLLNDEVLEKEISKQKLVQDTLFKTTEQEKQDILNSIFFKQKEYFNEKNSENKKELKNEIESLENSLIEVTLKASGNEKKLEEIKKGRKERRKPYFLWKLEFAKVFKENNGFDIVIGNPPYGAEISAKDLKVLKTKFKYNENTNSVCIFMDFAMSYWMKPKGTVSMIVPKSLLYSEKWFKLVENLYEYTPLLVDVEKAFEKVKLEQVFYVANFSKKIEEYYARKFLNNEFVNSNYINTKMVMKFKSWICDVKQEELTILSKILKNIEIEYMKDIVDVKRGIGVQKLLKEEGSVEVIGGKQCQRYFQDGIKGFLNEEDIKRNKTKLEFMLQPKIISQDLVAHIQNPVPHIKLSSFYDEQGKIIGLDTIQNIIITSDKYNPRFILALLNSNFINWYTYKFIYSSAIRTMHFDKNYIGKIIVPKVSKEIQDKISEKVKIIEKLKKEEKSVIEIESKINELIYNLYLLDDVEKNIIDFQFSLK